MVEEIKCPMCGNADIREVEQVVVPSHYDEQGWLHKKRLGCVYIHHNSRVCQDFDVVSKLDQPSPV